MAALSTLPRRPFVFLSNVARTTCRRRLRIFVFVFLISLALVFHLRTHTSAQHHALFEPPATRLIVHGDPVDGLPELQYPLDPFPYSPLQSTASYHVDNEENTDKAAQQNPWLAAVISSAGDAQRRNLIRSTWMSMYCDIPFDGRFVVANPGPQWTDAVAKENGTFGDIIVLDRIAEDDITANTIKTLELYKWLVDYSPRRYDFVSKMDTDVWINAHAFWNRFLLPRMERSAITGKLSSTADRTMFGELYYSKTYDLVFPQGAMYTVTWDMVALLASLQAQFKVITGEDMAIAVLLLKAREQVKFVNFRGTEKFDFDEADTRGDGTAWARPGTHPNATYHALVGSDPIVIHQLKSEVSFRKVAECFDGQGIKIIPPQTVSVTWKSWSWSTYWHDFWTLMSLSGQYESRFHRIPDAFWTQQHGDWICDGIWNLGQTKEGFSTY